MYETLLKVTDKYDLIAAFAVIGLTMWFSYWISGRFTRGRVHGSAIAILLGLTMAYLGGLFTGGEKGVVDIPLLSGIGLLGGSMLRDFAIVATGFGVNIDELKQAGISGVIALVMGILSSFFAGLMGTSSGVAAGLAATDPKLVPYGCLTAAFYTALGCLLGPSLLFILMRGIMG